MGGIFSSANEWMAVPSDPPTPDLPDADLPNPDYNVDEVRRNITRLYELLRGESSLVRKYNLANGDLARYDSTWKLAEIDELGYLVNDLGIMDRAAEPGGVRVGPFTHRIDNMPADMRNSIKQAVESGREFFKSLADSMQRLGATDYATADIVRITAALKDLFNLLRDVSDEALRIKDVTIELRGALLATLKEKIPSLDSRMGAMARHLEHNKEHIVRVYREYKIFELFKKATTKVALLYRNMTWNGPTLYNNYWNRFMSDETPNRIINHSLDIRGASDSSSLRENTNILSKAIRAIVDETETV